MELLAVLEPVGGGRLTSIDLENPPLPLMLEVCEYELIYSVDTGAYLVRTVPSF